MLLVTVGKDENLLPVIEEAARKASVANAALTLIGAVDQVELSVMQRVNASKDMHRIYDQPFEMHGTGELRDGTAHVHATFAGEDLIVAGHVHWAVVEHHFVNVYVVG